MTEIDTKFQSALDDEFNDEEKQIFSTFYEFLNKDNDFIITIEFAYKWIGFPRKEMAKKLLKKYLTINTDYTIQSNFNNDKNPKKNNEIILMTPVAFKQLCMVSMTEKGEHVRNYYKKLNLVLMKYLKQSN